MQKKRKFRRCFKSEAKKTNKDVEFYCYFKLIKIFKRAAFIARFYKFKCKN